MRYKVERYESDNKILAGVAGLRSPVHVTFDETKVSADADGRKWFDGGFFVAKSGDYARPLPRGPVAADVTTTDTTIVLDSGIQAFVPGDNIYLVPASAQIDLGAAWAAGDTLEITVAGLVYTHTASGTLTADQFAEEAAAAFNANPQTRGIAQAIAGENALTIVAADFKSPHAIAVVATGGTAALSAGATILQPFQMIGTVDAGGVDVANNSLTLTAVAAVAVAKGVPVGTADIPIGMHLRAHDLRCQAEEAGLYTSASAKRGAFPYLDAGLESQFVEIQAVNL